MKLRKKLKKLDKNNWRALWSGAAIIIAGGCLILFDLLKAHSETSIWINVGCSLLASGLVISLNAWLVERSSEDPLERWGISRIYQTRGKMNEDCDDDLNRASKQVDVVAFGIKSFRTTQEKLTKKLLKKGVNFRIITMDPESEFISQREKEEGEVPGQIQNTVESLVTWANNLNKLNSSKGKISVKGYSCMTLDFYWRVDDAVYFGPYWYGVGSQQTVSYRYEKGGFGFDMYTDYFEKLWSNSEIMRVLVLPE